MKELNSALAIMLGLFFSCITVLCNAQLDSIKLNEALVLESSISKANELRAIESILLEENGLAVKNSGLSNLTTLGVRGGSTSQLSVSWNGIEISNPMLGQSDFSQFSSFMFNDLKVDLEGKESSSITGSFDFSNSSSRKYLFSAEAGFVSKSFDHKLAFGEVFWRKGKSSTALNFFTNYGENDFRFPSTDGSVRIQSHSRMKREGFLLKQEYILNGRNSLQAHVWWQNSFTEIPLTVVQSLGKSFQNDDFLRAQLHYYHKGDKVRLNTKLAFSEVYNEFNDSLNGIFSVFKYNRLVGKIEAWKTIGSWDIGSGFSSEFITSKSPNYTENKARVTNNLSLKLARKSNDKTFVNNIILSELSGDYFLSANSSYGFNFLERNNIEIGLKKGFRIPSMNDLYWVPGGNPNLKAENSLSAELSLARVFKSKSVECKPKVTAYLRNTSNWILWTFESGNSFWQASNIPEVNTKGVEYEIPATIGLGESFLNVSLSGTYLHSLFSEDLVLPEINKGDQVYYVPKTSNRLSLKYSKSNWRVNYRVFQNGASPGVRYSIDPFTIHEFSISRVFQIGKTFMTTKLEANNILNERYEMVEFRPLPGRHYSFSINFKFIKR